MRRFIFDSEADLVALGARLGKLMHRQLVTSSRLIVLLRGPVGSGKSCFVRGCVRAAIDDADLIVSSPTFVLLNSYESKDGAVCVHHLDLYRLGTDESQLEILDLPLLHSSGHMMIEWPDVAGTSVLAPWKSHHLYVTIDLDPSERRLVTLSAEGEASANWLSRI